MYNLQNIKYLYIDHLYSQNTNDCKILIAGDRDDFPLPSTDEEIKAFDQELFVECTRTVEVDLKEKGRSRSIPDLLSLRTKLFKLQGRSCSDNFMKLRGSSGGRSGEEEFWLYNCYGVT